MALASQTIRNQGTVRAYSQDGYLGRRKRGRTALIALGALVVVGGALWIALRPGKTTPKTEGNGAAAAAPDAGAQKSSTEARLPEPKNRPTNDRAPVVAGAPERRSTGPAPAEISMGTRAPSGVTQALPEPSATRADTQASQPARPPAQPTQTPVQPQPQPAQPAAQQSQPQPAPTQPAGVAAQPQAQPSFSVAQGQLDAASQLLAQNRPVQAREQLNRLLADDRATDAERESVRRKLAEVSQILTFGPTVVEGDPFAVKYAIQSGDSLVKVAKRENLGVDWRFIQRINRMSDPGKLTVGQTIKLVRGPFHAVVSKGRFRLDLYQGAPPALTGDGVVNTAGGSTVFIASFPVGLGEFGSTPMGAFMVKQNSKLVNPAWRNPRTGEQFSADDAKNPIGERWVGLEGIEERTRSLTGYGLHGTIEPESIGHEKSMGCVRMLHDDIGLIYELMTEGVSTVQIVP